MIKYLFSFLISLCSTAAFLDANIVETPNLTPLESEIERLDEETLMVFDVDWTLIVPQDKSLRFREFWSLAKAKTIHLPDGGEHCESLVLLQSKSELIDQKVLDIISALKNKNVKVIALTAMRTGKWGHIPSMVDWRIQHLATLGIDFSPSAPYADEIAFTEFHRHGYSPVFKQGIIASGRYPKGEVLAAFLRRIDWKPKKVIFIDDYIEFVKSVESEMEKFGVDHTSYLYTAMENLPHEFDEERAHFQIDHLIQHGIWLSDEEAHKLMGGRCLTTSGEPG